MDQPTAATKPLAIEDAHAMLVPVMVEIAKLPTVHDRAIIWLADQGDRAFLYREVARRTQAGGHGP